MCPSGRSRRDRGRVPFIRGYRVGHTPEGEAVIVVVEAQVKGGCHVFDDNGHIGGDGVGRWHAFYALRALNLSWLMTLKPKKRSGGNSSRKRISSDAKTRTRSIHRSFNRSLFYLDETLCTVPLLGLTKLVVSILND